MAISIVFNMVNVAGQERNGTVSIGEVSQNGWSAHSKQNIGQGMLFGINNTLAVNSFISDQDVIDAPIADNDLTTSGQNQSL